MGGCTEGGGSPCDMEKSYAWRRSEGRLHIQISVLALLLCVVGCGAKTYPEQGYEVEHFGGGIFGGGFRFRITETYWSENYSGATPEHKYLIVKTAITNPQNAPCGFTSKYTLVFMLINQRGTQYAPKISSGEFGLDGNINPNMTAEGVIVFDVPNGNYALETAIFNKYREPDFFDTLIRRHPGKVESYRHPLEPTER